MQEISETEHKKLVELLERRRELKARHANSDISCYSLKQKILIQRDRKADLNFLNDKIDAIMKGKTNA